MAQQPIQDFLLRGEQHQSIDLIQIFGAGSRDFTVTTSDAKVIAASIGNGVLTLDPQAFGHADIHISGTTATGEAISDNFRARAAGENAYTIAVLPDTQNYTSDASISHIFGDMTQWLVDNRDSKGIQFVVGVGDVTGSNTAAHWDIASAALRKLDGNIPYSLLPGNHDQANGGSAANYATEFLDTLFSPEKQAATNPDTFGGVYDREPASSANTYHTFTAPDGTQWLVMSLEFAPRDDVVRWAGEIVEAHLDHRVMLSTHNYMSFAGLNDELPQYGGGPGADYGLAQDPQGYSSGKNLWENFVSKYPNISMVFSGHIVRGDGAETAIGYTQHGNPVLQMLMNYQNGVAPEIIGNQGGQGAIRLITIDPDNDAVYTDTYLTNLDEYLDGSRGSSTPDRDGLTGPYLEHQEVFTGIDFGVPQLRAQADAGLDVFTAAAAGAKAAEVLLDGSGSLNPDLASSYAWLDQDGQVVSREINPTVTLGAGRHALTLRVEDAAGRVTTDQKIVVVTTDDTLLFDNFNDGNANGWSLPSDTGLADGTKFATASALGLPALPGGDADVMAFAALPLTGQGYLVKPGFAPAGGGLINDYTIAFDVLVPSGQGAWFPFFQADANNQDDAELFVNTGRTNGGLGNGIGNSGRYFGDFTYDAWHRVILTVSGADEAVPVLNLYMDGVKLGTINYTSKLAHYGINPETGFLLFNDNTAGATSSGFISSLLLTDKVMTDEEAIGLGGATAGGILAEAPTGANAFQLDFGADAPFASTFGGAGNLSLFEDTEASIGSWTVRGTHAAPGATPETSEGQLYEISDAAGQSLLWNAPEAKNWHDYTFQVTARSTDDDEIGVIFYYRDDSNYYRFETYAGGNYRRLIKVEDGEASTLAQVSKGYVFDADIDLKVAVAGDTIEVFMNGKSVFGPVVDAAPLPGGTIGVYSNHQNGTSFDNVLVNRTVLTAHGEGGFRAIDLDGDGTASMTLSAASSYGPAELLNFSWRLDGEEIAQGRDVTVDLPVGTEGVTLVVTDASGASSSDFVKADIVGSPAVLLHDDFGTDTLARGAWRIIDQDGSIGTSDWRLQNGRLEQRSSIDSLQLTRDGNGVWGQGWSPLGDGVNVLRKGTVALYDHEAAKNWTDYSVEATINTPTGADANGLGLVFHYQDERNYYKLELDSVGVLWNLVVVKDGIEELLDRVPGRYEAGSSLQLRVDIVDNRISAFLNGEAIFAASVEDRELSSGTFGLYSWRSAGVSFDYVVVVDLTGEVPDGPPILGTEGDDLLVGGEGNDHFMGGAGYDVVAYSSVRDAYALQTGEERHRVSGPEGNDILDGIEEIRFRDSTVELTSQGTGHLLERLYDGALGRGTDGYGLAWWADQQADGSSLSDIARRILESDEAAPQRALADGAFVDGLYGSLLGRGASVAESEFWTGMLGKGMTRGDLLLGVASSTEAAARQGDTTLVVADLEVTQIARAYEILLGRTPDEEGLTFWHDLADSGASVQEILAGMATSAEFHGLFASMDDIGYVQNLYGQAFGREGEAEGVAFWAALMDDGMDHATVAHGMFLSEEGATHLQRLADDGVILG